MEPGERERSEWVGGWWERDAQEGLNPGEVLETPAYRNPAGHSHGPVAARLAIALFPLMHMLIKWALEPANIRAMPQTGPSYWCSDYP